MRMTHVALTALCAGTMVAGLTACSGGGGDDSGTVHLVFRQFDPAGEVAGLQQAVDSWNASHPDIQVEMQTLSPNNPQQFAREANSGSGPDIQQVAFADTSFLANPKVLLPLDDLIASAPLDQPLEDFLALDMVTYDEQTWAVPWTADTMALVYRPDALEAAGIDAPPTTWEELAEDAASISAASNGDTAGFCFGASSAANASQWFAINYYIWDHGSALVQQDSSGAWSTGISQDDLAHTIDYFNGLFESGATPKSFQAVNDYTDPSIANGLATGSCAMTYEPPQSFRTLVETAGDAVMTAPVPGGLNDGSSHLGGRGLAINASTDHPEEAWEFVKYLTGVEAFDTYQQYPASKKTISELDAPANESGFLEQLPHSESFGRYIGSEMPTASMQQLVNQQFSAVYSGQSSSTEAAKAILDGLTEGIAG